MLAKRIIPCLDVKNGEVVKGIQFKNHRVVGDVVTLVNFYCESGADELVFYDITASSDGRVVDRNWIKDIAKIIDIPFCVAGGIRTIQDARAVLAAGADKISINSPALENPQLIAQFAEEFGSQCVVVGVDSFAENGNYVVYQYTGDEQKTKRTSKLTAEWIAEVAALGAGEIVLNCMNKDGVRAGYDIEQLKTMRTEINIPLIASGGAGRMENFRDVFHLAQVDGALAASVFHQKEILIHQLKKYLVDEKVKIRL